MEQESKISVKLVNRYAPWSSFTADIYRLSMRGYAFIGDKYYSGDSLVKYVSGSLGRLPRQNHLSILDQLIPILNGGWALVYETHGSALAAVDRLRSIPLFYANENGKVFLSDNAGEILRKMPNTTLDDVRAAEFLLTGYVTGKDTLYKGLYQIQPGEILNVNTRDSNSPKIDAHRYYRFVPQRYCDSSEHELEEELCDLFHRVFSRYAAALKGKTPVIPLSGGLDSRLIAAMLKKCGVENAICFSYGTHGNKESEISLAVAESLGYKRLFCLYDYPSWYKWFREKSLHEYIEYVANRSSLFHIQDWPSVRETLNDVPSRDVVFLPGHTGDFLTGGHIPKELLNSKENAECTVLAPEAISLHHYELWPWRNSNSSLEQMFLERIESVIPPLTDTDRSSAIAAYENWDFENRQARYIINSVRVYEFFGCEWMLPWWDYDLMDFFLKIEPNLRYQKRLYRHTLLRKIFITDLSDLRSIPVLGLPLSESIGRNGNYLTYSDSVRRNLKRAAPVPIKDVIRSLRNYRGDFLKRYGRWKRIEDSDRLAYFRLLQCKLHTALPACPKGLLPMVQAILEPQMNRSVLACHINALNSGYYLMKLSNYDRY